MSLNDLELQLQVWDTAGQERFIAISRSYYRGLGMCIIVYDITSRNSFERVEYWINQLEKHCTITPSFVLVGNKTDLEDQREISYDEGVELAQEFGCQFYETTSKDYECVKNVFQGVLELYYKESINPE